MRDYTSWPLKSRMWTPAEETQLRQMWNRDRMTAAEIAAVLPFSPEAVCTKARRMGLDARPRPKRETPPPKVPRAVRRVLKRAEDRPQAVPPDTRRLSSTAWDALPGTVAVGLVDLDAGMCKWPIGEGKPYLFCGLASDGVYCARHAAMSRGRGTESERAAHRARVKEAA